MAKYFTIIFVLLLLISDLNAQYSPNFSVLNKGITLITTTAQECNDLTNNAVIMNNPVNCPTYNMSGMNWTLTGTTTDPFQFLYGVPINPASSYAVTIAGNKFQTRRPLGDICVTSPVINIASAGAVSITISVTRTGTGGYSSVDDDVEFKYSVNGGTVVTTGSLTGIAGSTSSKTWTGITGNTLRVWACMAANGSTEEYDLTTFTVSGGTVLPIMLSSFFANRTKDNEVKVTWQTASESQNKGFDIERSTDGSRFEKIGFVAGKGTTSETQNYSFEDKSASGLVYYRLKQLDFDGRFEYSHVLVVDNKSKEDRFVVAPNPVSDMLNIEYLGRNNDTRSIEIYDVFGKLIYQVSNDLQENEINTSNLQSGTYIWKINQNGNIQSGKFIKM